MSTRTHFVSITSIDPIREAVASNDDALVDAVMTQYTNQLRKEYDDEEEIDNDELEEFREYVESMILCPSPPEKEPGCWNYVIELLAKHFKLKPDDKLPFNDDWKHYHVWEAYRALVAAHITPESDKSLKYLENGRPLKGSRIDHDGCVFGWLAPDEVKELYRSLSQLDKAVITDEDLLEFHDGLVKSLKIISKRNAVLLMAAH
ncbi:MAG TPA: hypothetical protein VH575_00465 [Gemmataceae bacterium]|jgi:hypothetical protein